MRAITYEEGVVEVVSRVRDVDTTEPDLKVGEYHNYVCIFPKLTAFEALAKMSRRLSGSASQK